MTVVDFLKRNAKVIFLSICVAVAMRFVIFDGKERPFVHPHLKAEPFVWPVGCPARPYAHLYITEHQRFIPSACVQDRNIFGDADKYGFRWYGRGPRKYYRIGNDVVELGCSDLISAISASCSASDAIENVFYQSGANDQVAGP